MSNQSLLATDIYLGAQIESYIEKNQLNLEKSKPGQCDTSATSRTTRKHHQTDRFAGISGKRNPHKKIKSESILISEAEEKRMTESNMHNKKGKNQIKKIIDNSEISWSSELTTKLSKMELEAIFYPKFDNENLNDQKIRKEMLASIFKSTGYLEVSLKHSGSLILWSGYDHIYSKNSMNNKFTLTAEILLHEHFIRAWSSTSKTNNGDTNNDTNETQSHDGSYGNLKFLQCSKEMKELNLTCSFECVTSILGHHGDIPNQDYIILTGIADKTKEKFYSTSQVIQFAQKWRLPHNDVWIFHTPQAANNLFYLYDTTKETGLADSTINALNKTANCCIESMYPHVIFQGNILEGIVIRLVTLTTNDENKTYEEQYFIQNNISIWKELSAQSKHVLSIIPSGKPFFDKNCKFNGASVKAMDDFLSQQSLTPESDDIDIIKTLESVVLSKYHQLNRRQIQIVESNSKSTYIIEMVNNLLEKIASSPDNTTADYQTKRIAKLIQKLNDMNTPLVYKIHKETTTSCSHDNSDKTSIRWLCTLHILRDSSFSNYHQNKEENEMHLFRGFVFRLIFEGDDDLNNNVARKNTCISELKNDEKDSKFNDSKGLMLKMKFLPYMIRTFCCRNGLSILASDGIDAFLQYTINMLQRWNVSQSAFDKWQPFFHAWSIYAYPKLHCANHNESKDVNSPLTSSSYLHHFEIFNKMYSNGNFDKMVVDESNESSFRGLVVIVGLNKDETEKYATQFANELGCKVSDKWKLLNEASMANALRAKGGGMVYHCDINDKGGNCIRRLLNKYSDAIYIVLFSCSDNEVKKLIRAKELSKKEEKKMMGKIGYWKSMRSKIVICLKNKEDPNMEENDYTNCLNDIPSLAVRLRTFSNELPEPDNRPGLLVFFPCIPGSGKSTLCELVSNKCLNQTFNDGNFVTKDEGKKGREIIIETGDKTSSKIKFWPSVEIAKLEQTSSILIADKNAPPSIWRRVGEICTSSKSIAVPVFPDTKSLMTTSVSITLGKGTKCQLTYPFTLQYLAVCISRVLARPPHSHDGKLDSSLSDTCMIVVKFFGFFQGLTSDSLIDTFYKEMLQSGSQYTDNPIKVPFFKDDVSLQLPENLKEVLLDSLRLRVCVKRM